MTNVAQTILDQLGGRRFVVMTGSKEFIGGKNELIFKLARGVKNKAQKCRITLTAMDDYTVEFLKWNRREMDFDVVSTHQGIYCDMLEDLFTEETGLYTRF